MANYVCMYVATLSSQKLEGSTCLTEKKTIFKRTEREQRKKEDPKNAFEEFYTAILFVQ